MIWTALSNCTLLTMIFCWIRDAEFQSRLPVYISEAVQAGRGEQAQLGHTGHDSLKCPLARH